MLAFDSDGNSHWSSYIPNYIYGGSDVYEVYWKIIVDPVQAQTPYSPIPNSESPKYYVVFNEGGVYADAVPPEGDVPTIVRAEFNNIELSKDMNNPTQITAYDKIKLVGNSACVKKEMTVLNSSSSNAILVYFNSSGLGVCEMSELFTSGSTIYNVTNFIEFSIFNDGYRSPPTSSPTYYVKVLEKDAPAPPIETPSLLASSVVDMTIGSTSFTINGKSFDMDAAPFIQNDLTFVPVRYIAEALGATLSWDEKEQKVSIEMGSKNVHLIIGEPIPGMSVAPFIKDGRTFVPLRFVSESFGAKVNWDDKTRTIEIIV